MSEFITLAYCYLFYNYQVDFVETFHQSFLKEISL